MLLEVQDLNTYYGMSHVLQGISLNVNQGELVTLLGRNGMGKSTTLKSVMGLVKPKSGSVVFGGKTITGYPPYKAARAGIGYVPEDRRIFPNLSVSDNLFLGVKGGKIGDANNPNTWTVERIFLHFPMLEKRAQQQGRLLSGGEQQMLTIGRTLMGNPSLLLLDEPVEGLAPVVVQELTRQILHLKTVGLSILFAEQNIQFATEISDRAYVVEGGRVRYAGTMADLEKQPEIKQKYLMI
jgi:branched-chain amino acid transport system ATP-binding protein